MGCLKLTKLYDLEIRKSKCLRSCFLFFLYALIPVSFLGGRAFSKTHKTFSIHLRWQKVPGVSKYKIQIGTQPNFQTILEDAQTEKPEWNWKYQPEAQELGDKVYYRVASVSEQGDVGSFSDPQELELPKIEPEKASENSSENSKNQGIAEKSERKDETPEIHGSWRFGALVELGFGNFLQKSNETNLKQVTAENIFFQQRGVVHIDTPDRNWFAQIQFQYAPFHKIQNPRTFDQPSVSSYSLRGDVLHVGFFSSSFRLLYGLMVDRSFRWFKQGSEAVSPQGAFSGGPAVTLAVHLSERSFYKPAEVGLYVGAPLTGFLTGDQRGVVLTAWSDWNILKWGETEWGCRIQGDFNYFNWSTPQNTSILVWSGWGGIVFHTESLLNKK